MPPTVQEQIQIYTEDWWSNPKRHIDKGASESTFTGHYQNFFHRLQTMADGLKYDTITPELLTIAINTYDVGTQQRCRAAGVYKNLADLLGVPIPKYFAEEAGAYDKKNKRERYIPTDKEIFDVWEKLPETGFQGMPVKLMYSLGACFGLRTHETLLIDVSRIKEKGIVVVDDQCKTGSRIVYSLPPSWIDQFGIRNIKQSDLPKVKDRRESGHLATKVYYYCKEMPFPGYSLRHAYAIRSIRLDVKPQIACKLMGHSLDVHTRTYHSWLTENEFDLNLAHLQDL